MKWRWSKDVNDSTLHLHLEPPTLEPASTLSLQLEQAFVGCPLSFVRKFLVTLGRRLTRQKGPRLNRCRESLTIEGGAERFRDSTGGGGGFVSPAGRVRGRRRAAPSAFVVAAAGRLVAEGRALRADTKRRGAPFTKARVRGTRKCHCRSSRHENASPCSRISTCCEGRKTTDFTDWRGFLDKWKSEKSSALSSHFVKWRGECRGDGPRWVVHESSQIDTNFVHIREIRVDSWTATSARAHLALVHLGDRERGGAISCLDGRRGGISCRPQGAFVAGGARRRRLSWLRPKAVWKRVGATLRGRGRRPPCGRESGASRGHETARRAVHESPRARDAKAPGPFVESRKRFAMFSKEGNNPHQVLVS